MNLGAGYEYSRIFRSRNPNSVPDSNSVIRKGISDMSRTKLTRSKLESPEAKGKDREIDRA